MNPSALSPLAFTSLALVVLLAMGLLGYLVWLVRQQRQRIKRMARHTAELEDERELFRSLIDHSATGVFILQGEHFITVNPALTRLLRRSRSALLSMPFEEVVHPDDRAQIAQRARARLAGKAVTEKYEIKLLTSDGETRWAELSAGRVDLRSGPATIGTIYDTTHRRTLEDRLRANEAQYRQLVENVHDIIYTLAPDGTIGYVSPRWTAALGYPTAEVIGTNIREYVYSEDMNTCGGFLQQVIERGGTGEEVEYRIRHRDGSLRWHLSSGAPILDPDGAITGYVGVARDVTERRSMQEEIQFQARFNALLAGISSDFVSASADTMSERIDAALASIGQFFNVDRTYLFELSADGERMQNTHEWHAESTCSMMHGRRDVDLSGMSWWREQLQAMQTHRSITHIPDIEQMPDSAGTERELFRRQGVHGLICAPILFGDQVTGFIGMDILRPRTSHTDEADLLLVLANLMSEALQRNRLETRLRDLSLTDPLTGLHNRRYLVQRLNERIEEFRRHGGEFALAVLDLDHFKSLNDTHGHLAGDQVLQAFANLLRQQHRSFDIVARFGGEEFVVVLLHADRTAAIRAVERLIEATRFVKPELEGTRLSFTVSAGLAWASECDSAALTPDLLIDRADERLYQAKAAGRDRLSGA